MLISRRAIFLVDGLKWIFWCSCNKARGSLISGLSTHVKGCYEDLCKDECLHIAAARCNVEEIDAVHALSPDTDFSGRYLYSIASYYSKDDEMKNSPVVTFMRGSTVYTAF